MEEKAISLADLSNYRLVPKRDWEKIKKLARELSQERNMWKEKYEELNKRHLALCDDHHHLSCAYCGFLQVVCAHNIDPQEILAATEEHEKGGVCGCRKVMEGTPGPVTEDDAWGNTFEQAAQKSSREEEEEGAKKTEEESNESDKVILTEEEVNRRLRGRHAVIHTSGVVLHIPVDFDHALHQDGKWCLCWRSGLSGQPRNYIFDEDDVVSMMEQGGTFEGKLSYAPTCEDTFSVNAPDEEEAK